MGFLQDNEEILEKLNGLIKIGEVSSVDYATGTARVVFDDDDSIVSNDLQVLQKNTFKNQDFVMPDIGEDVVCLFLPSGSEEGFILGSVYAGEVTPPESSGDKRTVVFEDGTKVSYDRASHELTVKIDGTTITANQQKISVTAPTIELNGKTTINGETTINGAVTTSDKLSTVGDITSGAGVTATADVVAAGKSLSTHTHISAAPGSPTGTPQ